MQTDSLKETHTKLSIGLKLLRNIVMQVGLVAFVSGVECFIWLCDSPKVLKTCSAVLFAAAVAVVTLALSIG